MLCCRLMRILFITQDFPPVKGGIQTYCYQLALEMSQQGHWVQVVCPRHAQHKNDNYPFKIQRISSYHTSLFPFPLLFKIRSLLRQENWDCVLYAQWQCALWKLFFKGQDELRHYTLIHGRELLTSFFGKITPFLARRVIKRLNGAIPNSTATQVLLKKVCPESKSLIVHPGVNAQYFQPKMVMHLRSALGLENKVIIMMITRLVARKNPLMLMKAFDALHIKYPDTILMIGGAGPEMESMQRLLPELKSKERIRLLGRIAEKELVDYFNLTDIFVLPSSFSKNDIEGFGIVYLEANACAKPVVGFNCGGAVDAIVNGETGILTEPDNLNDLISAIEDLIVNPEKRKALGEQGRKRAEFFSWKKNAEEISQYLQSAN